MAINHSTVSIFNLALSILGGEQLSSVQAPWENSTLGRQCLNLWPQVLDEALAAHPWSFAREIKPLAEKDNAASAVFYAKRYALPSDCLRPVGLMSGCDYILTGNDLLTNDDLAQLMYIRRIDNPAMFPPSFRTSLAYSMAAVLATAKQNDPRIRQDCIRMAQVFLSEAAAQDNNMQQPREDVTPWGRMRFSSGGIQWPA
jgi:hypothetical protein